MRERPLMTERFRRMAPVLGTIVAGATFALLMPAAWMRVVVFVATVIGITIAARRPAERDDDRWYGRR